jgi:hypothetical protein
MGSSESSLELPPEGSKEEAAVLKTTTGISTKVQVTNQVFSKALF